MSGRFLVRVMAPLAALSLLLLTVGVVAAWNVDRMQRNVSRLLAEDVARERAAEELEIDILRMQVRVNRFLNTGDPRCLEDLKSLRTETEGWLAEAAATARTPHEQGLVARVRQGYERLAAELDRLPAAAGGRQAVRDRVDDLITRELLPPANEYLTLNEEETARASRENQALAERLVFTLLTLGGCGAAAGLLAGYALARGLTRSMVQLNVSVRDAEGKLNEVVGPVTLGRGWSFRELEAALRRLAARVGEVVERLQQTQREVLHAEQLAAVGQLAAGMAHELRNPLMAMQLLVQAAAGQGPGAALRGRDLRVLEEEISRMEQSIRHLLEFARPPRPERRLFDLGGVLDQTLALLAARAGKQGVQLACDLPARPLVVEADVGQVRQVLLNLLLNALEAVPRGGEVRVAARPEGEGPDRRLAVTVADSGPGLPAGLGGRIFEPFVSTKEAGTGLGLPICKRLVEAHGGTLTAADRPEGGAVFTVHLPLAAERNA